jgi:hypothetical protein
MREEDFLGVDLTVLTDLNAQDGIEARVAHEALECDLPNKDVLFFLSCFVPDTLQNLVTVVSHSTLLLRASVLQ